MNRWIGLLVASAMMLITTNAPQADLPAIVCLDLVMTTHDVEPDTSQATDEYSWPDLWPDTSGWEEDPPGI